MAKKLISSDIIDANILKDITSDAEKLLAVTKELKSEFKEVGKTLSTQIKNNPLSSASDVKALENQTNEVEKLTSSIKELEKAEKVIEKQRLSDIKLQKDREKAFDSFNKQQEKAFDLQKKQNSVYFQSTARLRELKTELKELEITGRTNGKLYKALGQEFVVLNGKVRDAEEGVGEFQRNVGNYKQQLVSLKKELATLDPGSEKFNKTAQAAGVLQDKINDAKDATKAFASESKATTAKNLFGQIVSDIGDLDFKGAAEKAKTFATVVKSISFAEVVSGIKDFGSALLNVGKALLANPFTLILAGIVAVGLAIKETYDSWVQYDAIINKSTESQKAFIEGTKDLNKVLEETRLKNKVLAGELTQQQAERIKLDKDFKDKFIANRLEERKTIQDITSEFSKANAATVTEQTLSSIGIGSILHAERMKKAAESLAKERHKIEKNYRDREKILTEQYDADLKNLRLSDTDKSTKETIKKQKDSVKEITKEALFDWEQYYAELEQLRISNLSDSTDKQKQQAQLDFDNETRSALKKFNINQKLIDKGDINEIAKQKALNDYLIQLEQQFQNKLLGIDKKSLDEKEAKEKEKADKEKEAKDKIAKENIERAQKERNEILDIISKISDQVFIEINKRKEAQINALDEEVAARDKNITRQQSLAEKGLNNTLEFEKQKQDEAKLERRKLAEEQEKRQKRQVFYQSLIASLESSKTNGEAIAALGKAVAITAAAQGIAGFFKDGTENFKGKGTETSDSNLVAISKGESVITAKGTRNYEGLATAMNNGDVDKWVMSNYNGKSDKKSDPQLLMALNKVEQAVKNQTSLDINWDSHDNRVETMIRSGVKKTIKHVNNRPRI